LGNVKKVEVCIKESLSEFALTMEKSGNPWKEGAPMDWKHVCFVRALKESNHQLHSRQTPSGDALSAVSSLTSSKGEKPRLTVHWALNHIVGPHATNQ